jgi:hypothetical protein
MRRRASGAGTKTRPARPRRGMLGDAIVMPVVGK